MYFTRTAMTKYLVLLFFWGTPASVGAQVPEKFKDGPLIVTRFNSHIGSERHDSTWNMHAPIHLPNLPTSLNITIKDLSEPAEPDYICILREEYKLYDTVRMYDNPTVHLYNLSGGKYTADFVNLSNNHRTQILFSVETAVWDKWWFGPLAFFLISMVLGLILYYIYLIRLQEKLRLQRVRYELEMKALKAQMNPHFIFNCMSTIDAYILRKKFVEASDCLQKFSQLIRRVMENSERDTVNVQNDLDALNLYVGLEQERFSHSFDFVMEVDEALYDEEYQISPLLLQPFVENSILHGIRNLSDRRGLVSVEMKIAEAGNVTVLQVRIRDNGIGRKAAGEKRKREGHKSLGMSVTLHRITNYQERHGLKIPTAITDLNPGTLVEIKLPLVKINGQK